MAERRNLDRISRSLGSQPLIHDNPTVDALNAMVVALLGEVVVLRDRLDANERLSQARGGHGPVEVDGFMPDAEARMQRAKCRQMSYDRVLGAARDRLLPESLRQQQHAYDAVIADVSTD